MLLKEWLAVALGGMLGSLGRHAISTLCAAFGASMVPVATLVVNVLGCFFIGCLTQWSFHHHLSSAWWVVGMRVGLLGGLTTFSSFGLDVIRVGKGGHLGFSVALVALHLILGLAAVGWGMQVAEAALTPRHGQG
ncbi:MAG: putative fluoride ion transporter CrcB [Pirellulaceae bacterium]|nr:MAG: putative fluoride ion transporter CrcB [Pirellulaceae bacterium]